MTTRKKKGAVKDAIDAAKPAEASEAEDGAQKSGPEFLRRRFKMLETGLHVLKDGVLHWVSA